MPVPLSRSLAAAVVALGLLPLTAAPAQAVAPPNDTAARATPITALPTHLTQSTARAAEEPIDGTLALCPGGSPPAVRASVWFAYTATDDDGFAVDAGPATDYSVGFIVTAGAPRVDAEPVACGEGNVVVPTTPGTTYYVMAFADTFDDGGGTLEVAFLEVPPTPEVTVTVDRRAQLRRDGSVRLRGTYSCTGADDVDLGGTVQQTRRGLASDGFSLLLDRPVCDGEPHRWRARALPEEGTLPLRRGRALAHVSAVACTVLECVVARAEAVPVRLRTSGRR